MTPLFKKLNIGAVKLIHVLSAPQSFEPELAALSDVQVKRTPDGEIRFGMAFVKTLVEVEQASNSLTQSAANDVVLWMVYPKSSSKKYKCEFNRDSSWSALGHAGFEPVRQVALDEDWSALRFRRVEHIKTMKRNPDAAISIAGRKKVCDQLEASQTLQNRTGSTPIDQLS